MLIVTVSHRTSSSQFICICHMQVRELDMPLHHNQLLVVKFITLIREDDHCWCNDLLTEGMRRRRLELLSSKARL